MLGHTVSMAALSHLTHAASPRTEGGLFRKPPGLAEFFFDHLSAMTCAFLARGLLRGRVSPKTHIFQELAEISAGTPRSVGVSEQYKAGHGSHGQASGAAKDAVARVALRRRRNILLPTRARALGDDASSRRAGNMSLPVPLQLLLQRDTSALAAFFVSLEGIDRSSGPPSWCRVDCGRDLAVVDLARMCVTMRGRCPGEKEEVKLLDIDAETARLFSTCLDRYRKLEGRMSRAV